MSIDIYAKVSNNKKVKLFFFSVCNMPNILYKRILLKFSGEVLAGRIGYGIDTATLTRLATIIKTAKNQGVEIAIVVGGGNLFRGETLVATGTKRTTADHIGMLGTVMNAMAIYDALQNIGIESMVMSAYLIKNGICQTMDYKRADKFLANQGVVIFAGGTGNPFFTTDTAGALRGVEIGADIVLKATKVDGVYDSDPMKNSNAKRFDCLSFQTAIEKNLQIMDTSAFALCCENNLPIGVFNLLEDENNLINILQGHKIGTIVNKTGVLND